MCKCVPPTVAPNRVLGCNFAREEGEKYKTNFCLSRMVDLRHFDGQISLAEMAKEPLITPTAVTAAGQPNSASARANQECFSLIRAESVPK